MTEAIVEVVSGVYVRDGRLLMTQRPCGKDFEYTWETPGGKVDAGETHHQALQREWHEELLLRVRAEDIAAEPLWQGIFDNEVARADRKRVIVCFYQVRHAEPAWRGEGIHLRDGQGLAWLTPKEIACLPLSPANTRASTARWCLRAWGQK